MSDWCGLCGKLIEGTGHFCITRHYPINQISILQSRIAELEAAIKEILNNYRPYVNDVMMDNKIEDNMPCSIKMKYIKKLESVLNKGV